MPKTIFKLSLIIAFQILLISCKSKNDEMQEFVTIFNNSSQAFTNYFMKSADATIINEDEIKITFASNLFSDPSERQTINKLFPKIVQNLIEKQNSFKELINQDVVFKFHLLAKDNSVISSFIIDKKKMQEFATNKENAPEEKTSKRYLSPELNNLLVSMRKYLPIKDDVNGTTVIDIDINEEKELIYKIEISDNDGLLLKDEGNKEAMKSEMLKDGNIKLVYNSIKKYGIKNIKCNYISSKGVLYNQILISPEDLQ